MTVGWFGFCITGCLGRSKVAAIKLQSSALFFAELDFFLQSAGFFLQSAGFFLQSTRFFLQRSAIFCRARLFLQALPALVCEKQEILNWASAKLRRNFSSCRRTWILGKCELFVSDAFLELEVQKPAVPAISVSFQSAGFFLQSSAFFCRVRGFFCRDLLFCEENSRQWESFKLPISRR